MKNKGISRREFLKGSAAGALSLAAMGLLSGCVKQTESKESENPSSEEKSTDWLGTQPQIKEDQIVESYDCDVVVVGAGTAGLFAACSAVENGADTILIEKYGEEYGGSGIRDTLAALHSKQQIENQDDPDSLMF